MDFKTLFNQYLNVVTRFIPKPARVPVIGIDVGTSSIKAIELVNSNGVYEVRNWTIERIEGGDAKAALQRLVSKLRLEKQILVNAVSGKGTLIRYIDMPRMSLEDLRKSFVYDLDKYFPFDPQTIYSDCCIIEHMEKEKRMSVMVAAVKKEIVDERLKLFKDAGLELYQITTNSIATVNAFTVCGPQTRSSEHAKVILDIGGSASNLMIVKDGQPRFTRDIFVGSSELTKQIANALGIDMAQAEELKMTPGDKASQLIEFCDTPLQNLIAEIRLSMDYFMTEKNTQIDEVFLVGGGSLLKGIDGVFEKSLSIPVKIWNPLVGLKLSPQVASSMIHTHSSQLGAAIGLGLVQL